MKAFKPTEHALGQGEQHSLHFRLWLTTVPLSDFPLLFPRPRFPFASALGPGALELVLCSHMAGLSLAALGLAGRPPGAQKAGSSPWKLLWE